MVVKGEWGVEKEQRQAELNWRPILVENRIDASIRYCRDGT